MKNFTSSDYLNQPLLVSIRGLSEMARIAAMQGAGVMETEAMPRKVRKMGSAAIVEIKGVIVPECDPVMAEWFGLCSLEEVAADMVAAAQSDAEKIVLNVDSPGGQVTGVDEQAQKIAAINAGGKEVFAYTSGQMCSAAYYLAAGAKGVFSAATADVGSIGTLIVFYDQSRAFANAGIEPVVIRSGKHKGEGVPGTSLSPEMAAHLQSQVDSLSEMFKAHVTNYRKRVGDETMQGLSYLGMEAAKNGLVDGLAPSLKEFVARVSLA